MDPEREPDHPWNVNVRIRAERGGRYSRVRIIGELPADGQRFLMTTAAGNTAAGNTAAGNTAAGNTAAGNTAAGEDIRVLPSRRTQRLLDDQPARMRRRIEHDYRERKHGHGLPRTEARE
ncbi:DUF6879 family protein [Streptomyces sp. NPDC056730]|uniref:DUF6879 family protein n=1 Tax=unclassified Streptomyces TaxID=2593676 RepID=UPI00369749FB